jgi:hypothetical protein
MFSDNERIIAVVCPLCKKISDENLTCYDIVEHPMVWCYDCENSAYYYLDINADVPIINTRSKSIFKNLNHYKYTGDKSNILLRSIQDKNGQELIDTILNNNNIECFRIPLCKILNTVVELVKYASEYKLSQEEIYDIYNYPIYYSYNIVEKYNLEILNDAFDIYSNIEKIFNLSLECNSYFINKPIKKYPKGCKIRIGDGGLLYNKIIHQGEIKYSRIFRF